MTVDHTELREQIRKVMEDSAIIYDRGWLDRVTDAVMSVVALANAAPDASTPEPRTPAFEGLLSKHGCRALVELNALRDSHAVEALVLFAVRFASGKVEQPTIDATSNAQRVAAWANAFTAGLRDGMMREKVRGTLSPSVDLQLYGTKRVMFFNPAT